jgi:HEAT repeat protein
MTVAHFGYLAALVLLAGCVSVVVALLVLRVGKDRAERRHARLRAPVWRDVMVLSTGEPDEVDEAFVRLLATDARERAVMLADAFALVPKLRGSARDRLREVLRHWGSVDDAVRSTRSRSRVQRCRGYHRLGVLAEPALRDVVLTGLEDRDFAVRRTAMIALGSFPESVVIDHLLTSGAAEPRLRRDFLASVDRIGSAAVPTLRRALIRSIAEGGGGDRRGFLAAEALGLVGAMAAVPTLEEALQGSSVELKIACMHALGRLGAPSSVVPLSGPLGHGDPDVRRVAATSLGLVGGTWAVPALLTVLHDDSIEVARAAANALSRCGPRGRAVLEESSAPVAREVLALAALGEPA